MGLCEVLDNHLELVLICVLALVICTRSMDDIKRISNDPTVLLGAGVAGLYVGYTTNLKNGILAAGIVVVANSLLNFGAVGNTSKEHFAPNGMWNVADSEQVDQFQNGPAEECADNNAVKEMSTDEKVVCNLMGSSGSDELHVTSQEIKEYLAKKTEKVNVTASNDSPVDYQLMDVCSYFDYTLDNN